MGNGEKWLGGSGGVLACMASSRLRCFSSLEVTVWGSMGDGNEGMDEEKGVGVEGDDEEEK